jgi:two-component system sensor histidine kinase MtrB
MAATLQGQLRELEELSKAQRQFVSDVSHELRTPMTTIRMAAEILFDAREQLDAGASRSVELLQSQIERFEVLLTDLLEISRHDANVATLDPEPIDVCDLARRSADDAQQLAERRGCRIEFRLPAEPCIAEVDRRRVDRILRNLLVNAVEHGEGKDVVVTVAADRDAVAVAVRDHGVGLAPGEEVKVFERFWRADPSRARTTGTGGNGLGLAIALEDAHLHGGWLQAWGEKGRGSVFRLTVPRVAGQPIAGAPLPLGPDEADAVTLAVVTGAVEDSLTDVIGPLGFISPPRFTGDAAPAGAPGAVSPPGAAGGGHG